MNLEKSSHRSHSWVPQNVDEGYDVWARLIVRIPTAGKSREYLCVTSLRQHMERFDGEQFVKVRKDHMNLLASCAWKSRVLDTVQQSLEHPDLK
jgi:hypothetical protein